MARSAVSMAASVMAAVPCVYGGGYSVCNVRAVGGFVSVRKRLSVSSAVERKMKARSSTAQTCLDVIVEAAGVGAVAIQQPAMQGGHKRDVQYEW